MSQSPPNYMDGVPVKISEHFRPPPKITLPQSVINRLAQIESGGGASRVPSSSYDFELEETVLKRITEWRAAKEKERYERDRRVRLKEDERARFAEEEQKRKLNQISYPNTDDLSSASDDEGEDEASEENDESLPSGSSEEQPVHTNRAPVVVMSKVTGQYNHMNQFDTILIPTVLPDVATSNISASEKVIHSGGQISFNIPKSTNLLNNNNNNNNNGYNKINYSDFENDTSSPFDNMELKTMNDLDILAQVLNLNVSNSGSEKSPEDSDTAKPTIVEQTTDLNVINETPVEQKTPTLAQQQFSYGQQQQQPQYQQGTYQMPQLQAPSSTDYYNSYHYNYGQYAPPTTTSTACYTPTENRMISQYNSASNASYQQSQYHSYSQGVGSAATASAASTYDYFPYTSSANNPATRSTYAHGYLFNNAYGGHQSHPVSSTGNNSYHFSPQAATTTTTASTHYVTTAEPVNDLAEASSTIRSKSKSVPDIVRQLDEEVQDSAQRRTRNNSQSIAERHQDDDKTAIKSAAVTPNAQDFTIYNQLSLTDQNMVKRIGSMGFPLERVAAVLKRIGSDDKKIVEHLIPLSELLDLGFEEEKISEALMKFSNNKHKALDFLIS